MKTQTSSRYIKSNRITFLKLTYITQFVSFLTRNFAVFFHLSLFQAVDWRFILGLPTMQTNLQVARFWPRNNAAEPWPWRVFWRRLPGCISHMKSLVHPITLKLFANKFVWYMKNVFFSKNNFYILEVWLKKYWTCIHVGNRTNESMRASIFVGIPIQNSELGSWPVLPVRTKQLWPVF